MASPVPRLAQHQTPTGQTNERSGSPGPKRQPTATYSGKSENWRHDRQRITKHEGVHWRKKLEQRKYCSGRKYHR
jgi:hypothetical protein